MKFQAKYAYLLGAILTSFLFVTAASAQCGAGTCTLQGGGGLGKSHSRGQIGQGLPLPITAASAPTGLVWAANGRVSATNSAVVTIGGPSGVSGNARSLKLQPGIFTAMGPLVKIPLFTLNSKVFQVNTNLQIQNPAPSTNGGGPGGPVTFSVGGRTGPAQVNYCPGSPIPTPGPGGDPGCQGPGTSASGGPPILYNGIAIYNKTVNQFGGGGTGRTDGTGPNNENATVYHNVNGIPEANLPCAGGTGCQVAISRPTNMNPESVFGGPFGAVATAVPGNTPSAIYTANIGENGTIISVGAPVTNGGPFFNGSWPRQNVTSYGLPMTTGMLTISVTAAQGEDEIFVRTGGDYRNATGSGIVNMVGGALSDRTFSLVNGNRSWVTYYLPEPGALVAGASALMMLGGCHWLVRRRR